MCADSTSRKHGCGLGPRGQESLSTVPRCATEEISAVKFSPSGEFLAVGSHDNFIYILDAKQGCDSS